MTLSDFDAIRPFEPEELPAAYDRLVANPQFRAVVGMLYPQVPFEALEKMDLDGVKIMWTNYPNMPTGGRAMRETYEKLVESTWTRLT